MVLDVICDVDGQFRRPRPEAAYRLLENEEIPGWLSMPKKGATTVWEAWEGPGSKKGGIGSLNHYSKGAVCEWLFKTMCGIRIDSENHFTVKPVSGGSFMHAEAKYASIYGKIESGWKRNGGTTVFTVTVPPNCSATVILPDGTAFEQSAGKMTYEVK